MLRISFAAAAAVYPRPRGGTQCQIAQGLGLWGLSPPTRGNLFMFMFGFPYLGSIPAHAGEPDNPPTRLTQPEVYPRPRGGTVRLGVIWIIAPGLSPPTRGNR